jgi:hypothetical protein
MVRFHHPGGGRAVRPRARLSSPVLQPRRCVGELVPSGRCGLRLPALNSFLESTGLQRWLFSVAKFATFLFAFFSLRVNSLAKARRLAHFLLPGGYLVGRLEVLDKDLLPLSSDNDQPLHHAAIRLP